MERRGYREMKLVGADWRLDNANASRTRITSAADKQFTSLDDFQSHAEQYFNREVEQSTN